MATREQAELLWQPSEKRVERATLTRYREWLASELDLTFDDYAGLWKWSTDNVEAFWATVWEYFDVIGDYDEVLADGSMPGAKWFTGAELSYADLLSSADRRLAALDFFRARRDELLTGEADG